MGAQVLEYQVESQMIYFRKNYWIGTVISNELFNLLFDLLLLVKKAFLGRFSDIKNEVFPHMRNRPSTTIAF